jgi:hypothetical protein
MPASDVVFKVIARTFEKIGLEMYSVKNKLTAILTPPEATNAVDCLVLTPQGIIAKQKIVAPVDTYETVCNNLKSRPYTITRVNGLIASKVWDLGEGLTIVKTYNRSQISVSVNGEFNYTGIKLTSISLSGNGLPETVTLKTKNLNYVAALNSVGVYGVVLGQATYTV